jgi:predicted PurR-regulated permease PerM
VRSSPATLYIRRLLITVTVLMAATAAALILIFQIHVLLLGFAGLLLAVFLYRISVWIQRSTGMRYGLALAITIVVLLALCVGTTWLAQARISQQVDALTEQLPKAWHQLQDWLGRQPWGRWLMSRTKDQAQDVQAGALIGRGIGAVSVTSQFAADAFVILFVGIFAAISPQLYVRGTMRLIPPPRRARARQFLTAASDDIWWWLLGQLAAMAFIAIVTFVALWLLGVPLAFTLALISAVLNFIPNFGPILAAIPAMLLGTLQGPTTVLWIAIAYFVIQMLQNHLVTPVIQQKAVNLPPVVLILVQIFMWYWGGLLGTIVAPALAALAIRAAEMLYVHDVLGDPMREDKSFWPEEDTRRALQDNA